MIRLSQMVSMKGVSGCACDAAPKKPQTLEQHLKQYHDGKMPTGECKFLKQYAQEHPDTYEAEFEKAKWQGVRENALKDADALEARVKNGEELKPEEQKYLDETRAMQRKYDGGGNAQSASKGEEDVEGASKDKGKKDAPKIGDIRVFINQESVNPYKVMKLCPHNTSNPDPKNAFWQMIGKPYASKAAAERYAEKMRKAAEAKEGANKDGGDNGGKFMPIDDAIEGYVKNAAFGGTEASRRGWVNSMLGGYRPIAEVEKAIAKLENYEVGYKNPKKDPIAQSIANELKKTLEEQKKNGWTEGREDTPANVEGDKGGDKGGAKEKPAMQMSADEVQKKVDAMRGKDGCPFGKDTFVKIYKTEGARQPWGLEVHRYSDEDPDGIAKYIGEQLGVMFDEGEFEDGVIDENEPSGMGWCDGFFYLPIKSVR